MSAPRTARPIPGPRAVETIRARRIARKALGERVSLAVWTPIMQTYRGASGRLAHVWTLGGEYRVELPAPRPLPEAPTLTRR